MTAVPRDLHVALAFALVVGASSMAPAIGRCGTEEFSTFDVERQEEDDESLLDHILTRPPRSWRSEWERAPQALRTAQGCLTSGQWFILTDLKLSAPLGQRARFGLDFRQSQSDETSYDYLDFSFRFPTRFGTPGVMFRPLHDKSRQDLALTWDAGADTSALQLQMAFTFEDVFNNLWAFRQTRVGEQSEPYVRRPYEPALRMVVRQQSWRVEAGGRWLTPSEKRVVGLPPELVERTQTLWGTFAYGALEGVALGCDWEVRGENRQALSTDGPVAGEGRSFRRQWSHEISLRRPLGRQLSTEARWVFKARTQAYGEPIGPGRFEGREHVFGLESLWTATPTLNVRVGALVDRVSIWKSGDTPRASYGSRHERRAYVGLMARFGRVQLQAIEGIELDREPYEVWARHDKGFLHLQTTF